MSLIEIVEEVQIPEPPLGQPPPTGIKGRKGSPARLLIPLPMVLVSMWERSDIGEPEEFQARFRWQSPDRRVFAEAAVEVDLMKHRRCRTMLEAPGFPFIGFGTYSAVVEIKSGARWKKVGSVGFDLQKQAGPRPTAH